MNPIVISPTEARRLAVMAQGLAGPRPSASKETILDLIRSLGCIQIDPIRAVERTQLLVLWSRLGMFDPDLLDELQTQDRAIFEAWAHCASFVLTEDYPLFARWRYGYETRGGIWGERVRAWMSANDALRQHILERLRAAGPLGTADFDDIAAVPWESTGWNTGRNVTRMLDFLNGNCEVLSVGRKGNIKLWHLREEWMPEWAEHQPWPEEEVVQRTAQRSLKALGVATAKQIKNHFIRGKYPELAKRLSELQQAGEILPVQIVENEKVCPGHWYIHREVLPTLEAIRQGGWQPRTVLLSPFDNLICDRDRTEQLFDFYYRIEIYVPKAKRQYGYYVLPILHGDRLIGRMDSQMDRKTGVYHVQAIYPEHESDITVETATALAHTIHDLADFLGASRVAVGDEIPALWRQILEKEESERLGV